MGISLTPEERFEVFGDSDQAQSDPARYEEKVTERWGETDAYRQSRQANQPVVGYQVNWPG